MPLSKAQALACSCESAYELPMQKTFLFDVDHTLYPYSDAVEAEITSLIDAYLMTELGMEPDAAYALRQSHYHLFGTTLAGLMYFEGIQARDYLAYKDRFNLEVLGRDEAGLAALRQSPARMIAITNSHHNHGERVLQHLGIRDKFETIYGIEDMGYWGKPFRKSFDMVFADAGIEPRESVFFEDSVRNLAYPKRLGMTTILINAHNVAQGDAPDFVDHHVANLQEAMEIANAL